MFSRFNSFSDKYTFDEKGVSRRHTSDGETLLLFGFNIKEHVLHSTVLVPLYVPHDGHFFTPLLVDLPKSDNSALILFECAITILVKLKKSQHSTFGVQQCSMHIQ